jgi:uncharacterized protein
MKQTQSRFSLLAFFGLAFALSWLMWLPYVLPRLAGNISAESYVHFLGSLGPAFAALLVAWVLEHKTGLTRLLHALSHWRTSGWTWVAAILGPVLLLILGLLVARLRGEPFPKLELLMRGTEHPELNFAALLVTNIFFYGLGEELGWRGFALPRLAEHYGWLRAALLLSLFWAMWHIPLLLVNDSYRSFNPALLLGWFVSLVTGSLLTAWLYLRSDGSVLPVICFHGLLNVVMTNQGVGSLALAAMGAAVTFWGLWAAWQLVRTPRPQIPEIRHIPVVAVHN